jgi:UDP-3-O-[3-hydroxymyristoyl] glucosamine N-acyltransferase
MTFTAAQIAMIINGKVEGDAQAKVNGFGKIEEAREGQLAFLANPKYEEYLYQTGASIIIINEALELKQSLTSTLIRVPDPYTAFALYRFCFAAFKIPGDGTPADERHSDTLLYRCFCKNGQRRIYRCICLPE